MKLGVPWRVAGVRPDARETAREAARRAGMSVGEWLNTVILDSADEEGVGLSHATYEDQEEDSDQLFAVHERLDELTRQLEQLHRAPAPRPHSAPAAQGPEAYAPPSYQNRDDRLPNRNPQPAEPGRGILAAPPPPVHEPKPAAAPADDWTPDIDQAMAEITARMQALDADPEAPAVAPRRAATQPAAPVQPQAPAHTAPIPEQNLSGLETHLRHITSKIEALRQQPQLQEGIAALRQTLSEVARTLLDAMPKRAIEALEGEVRTLASRLDNSRQSGVDNNTLASIERGLADVLETLRSLRPAENLDSFRQTVHSLAQKIDMLGASAPDPKAFQALEAAVSTMTGFVSQVASNEALQLLAAEVQALAQNVDQVAAAGERAVDHSNALEILDKRIAQLADAFESRMQDGGSMPKQLEAVILGLTDKIERLQQSRGDDAASGPLQNRIAALVEKLDTVDTRIGQLEAVERGLADLLIHIEKQRSADTAGIAPQVDGLQRDLARTQSSVEAVHGTLGHVVDRLAMLDMCEARSQPQLQTQPQPQTELPQPEAEAESHPIPLAAQLEMQVPSTPPPVFAPDTPAAETSPPPSREVAHAQAAAAMARANPKAVRTPIDPNLPPDHPLEPGFSPRGGLTASPADRIAVSEAALGPVTSASADSANKSNFIAAARRAAKAAAAEPTTADLRAAAKQGAKTGKSFSQRMRKLFVGVSVILIAGGALHVATNLIDSGDTSSNTEIATVTPSQTEPPPGEPERMTDAAPSAPSSDILSSPDITATLPSTPPASQSFTLPPTFGLPAIASAPPAPTADKLPPSLGLPAIASAPPTAEKLPPAIGGAALRAAAAAGDAAAEYEVGVRYAEGRGVAANTAEAARWFELAAKHGLAMAQFRLAGFYEKAICVKKDVETARRLYKSAAEQGNAKAMHNLAVLYAEGAAVKPDYRTAAQWFRLAAEHGISDSQYNLAILYARGIGVDQNLVESYKWFALAAAQSDGEAAKKRDEVGKRLDPQSLASAKRAVQAFVAQPQPEAATTVKVPAGGWDAASSSSTETPPAKPKRTVPVRVGSR